MKARNPIAYVGASLALSALSSVLFSACGSSTCADRGNCTENGGSGGLPAGSAGQTTSGASGDDNGGASGVGASSGTAGHGGGAHAGGAGLAGEAGAPACDGECKGTTPVCDAASNTCVGCLKASDCKATKPFCDTASSTCVECVKSTDCKSPTKPACDTTSNTCVACVGNVDCKDAAKPFCDQAAAQCVACLKSADCTDAKASVCSAGACTACTADADCSNIAGKGVCDAGTCVQCTGKKFAACGLDNGTPLVCDSLMRMCTPNKQHSVGLCQPCVADAQCNAGEMCVLDKFGTPSKDVGYFCHWKKGDTANGAPSDCFASGKPYSGTQIGAVSIDGDISDLCTLRVSTCLARNQFGAKDCKVSNLPSDAMCGFSPAKDSKCAQVPSSSSYRCTMACSTTDDCPQFACDTGASPSVCALQ
jgi:hypothetical protein